MARFGICYLPKWVVIHNPRLFLLYWLLVLFLWIAAIWRFVELEQYAIQSPAKGVVSMLPFASGLSMADTSAAMEEDRRKDFCMRPELFEYNYSDPSHPDSKSFEYTNIGCTHLCDDASAVDQACINEAELTMDSAAGTFIPTFFSDMTTMGFGTPSASSHYFVPGITALKLAFSHNYFVHRPADLLSGPRETLHGGSDGAAGSGKAVVTVVLNHSGSILKRFEPGEPVSLTVQEVLTAAKTDEFGDSDSRLLLDYRYSNFDERIMLTDSAIGPQGPALRLTGADLKMNIFFTNKGYCQMDLNSERIYVKSNNADVACITVGAKRCWTQKHRSAASTTGSWTRTYHGLKISFQTNGEFSSFDTYALFESITIVFIWLQVPAFIIYLMTTFMLGTLSRVYSSVMHQQGGLIDSTAGIAARLMNYSSTFKDLQDDKGDVTKQRMLRRFNYILAYEDDLDANEREKYVDFVYKQVLNDGEGRTKRKCEMLEFCSACASGEPLSFEILQKFFNRRRHAGAAERLFQDSSVRAIHQITDSQLDLKGGDGGQEGDDEPLKEAAAVDEASLRRSFLGNEYMKSGSRLTDILLENDNLQSRCADVTASLEETLEVATSVIADGAEEDGARAAIYRAEVRRIGKSTKMTPQLLADGSVYAGEWVGAVRHGRGVLTRPDGSSYSGQFEHGVVHGYATFTLPTGAKYEGQWKNGKQDGEGRETTAEGAIYQGEYSEGKKQGQASIYYPDGSTYVGEVSDGKLHGQGKYLWSNGHHYEGDWEEDQMHGKGTYVWPTGAKFVGTYQNNQKHGYGTVYWPDGRAVAGTYAQGKQIL